MIDKKHVMQTMDWSKYDLPGWLSQCGAWQRSCRNSYRSSNPIAVAMKKAKVRLSKAQRAKLIAYYLCEEEQPKIKRHKMTCDITDNEARAIQRLVLDVINGTDSEALLDWMQVIISRYFNDRSWSQLETPDRTVMDAKYDVRCGLAVLHVRYPFIQYVKGTV
ncbi:hypothetical protein [Acinetobacter sp. XS-4]|uniref:hypothetical protein n=1 Tax=Acinetobacter sp. XS-4 TaxID=2923375 RepID=UPI00208F2D81|nr:hypothetical protein [Acinetobacter sp. XS-4]USP42182.1 hypothetical protein MMY79_09005 [Acinetobacter sp. XS-4]